MGKNIITQSLNYLNSGEFKHPYIGFLSDNIFVASTSTSFVNDSFSLIEKDSRSNDTIVFSSLKEEGFEKEDGFEIKELLESESPLIANPKFKLVVEYVVSSDNQINGWVEDKIVIATDKRETIYKALEIVKENYINKYSRHEDLASFRPEQINLKIKKLSIDNKTILDETRFCSKSLIKKLSTFVTALVEKIEQDNNDTAEM